MITEFSFAKVHAVIVKIITYKYQRLALKNSFESTHFWICDGPVFGNKCRKLVEGTLKLKSFQAMVLHFNDKYKISNLKHLKFYSTDVTDLREIDMSLRNKYFIHHHKTEVMAQGNPIQKSVKVFVNQKFYSLNISIENMEYKGFSQENTMCYFGGVAFYEHNKLANSMEELVPICWNISADGKVPGSFIHSGIISKITTEFVIISYYVYPEYSNIQVKLVITKTKCIGYHMPLDPKNISNVILKIRDYLKVVLKLHFSLRRLSEPEYLVWLRKLSQCVIVSFYYSTEIRKKEYMLYGQPARSPIIRIDHGKDDKILREIQIDSLFPIFRIKLNTEIIIFENHQRNDTCVRLTYDLHWKDKGIIKV